MTVMSNILQFYTAHYPIIMSLVWLIGAGLSSFKWQSNGHQIARPTHGVKVTILLAMFNEENTILETLTALTKIQYANYDVVIVDDKSTDHSVAVVSQWLAKQSSTKFRLIPLSQNIGKAQALNEAIKHIDAPFILATDADAVLAPDVIDQLLRQVTSDRVAAVTGKPVVRNRTTLLGRLQTLEYLGIIDRIKRAQASLYGGIMTVAGVVVLYRREALLAVNGFDRQAITEDIDITWRLRKQHWQIRYAADALVYILVPETVKGYFKQRVRWSVGGIEVFLKNKAWVLGKGYLHQKLLLLDMFFSHIWAWFVIMTLGQYVVQAVANQTFSLPGGVLFLYTVLFFVMFLQGMIQDKHQSQVEIQDLFAIPFYSLFYWLTALVAALVSQFQVVFFYQQKGSWESPDRGR